MIGLHTHKHTKNTCGHARGRAHSRLRNSTNDHSRHSRVSVSPSFDTLCMTTNEPLRKAQTKGVNPTAKLSNAGSVQGRDATTEELAWQDTRPNARQADEPRAGAVALPQVAHVAEVLADEVGRKCAVHHLPATRGATRLVKATKKLTAGAPRPKRPHTARHTSATSTQTHFKHRRRQQTTAFLHACSACLR